MDYDEGQQRRCKTKLCQPKPKPKPIKKMNTDECFRLLNDLTEKFEQLDVITDDGDRDETDARIWGALNILREELQNALHA